MWNTDGRPAVTDRSGGGSVAADADRTGFEADGQALNRPCLECRYFARETPAAKAAVAQMKGGELYGRAPDHVYGECRRRSPVVLAGSTSHCRWPIVYHDDWCGDWVSRFA
jgi:hypothetical protein